MNDERTLFESVPVPKALASLAVPTIVSQLIADAITAAVSFAIYGTVMRKLAV